MQELMDCIKENTVTNTSEIQSCISNMICNSELLELSKESLLSALEIEGEFLVLKLDYSDFEEELKSQKIKYKISQALSVVISYEDDGSSFESIEKFVKYVSNISDIKQNSIFGVKKVEKLSEFPITMLFSGILPINQLKLSVGEDIHKLISSDDEYYLPRFAKHRDDISKEIGIPILPVLPILDKSLEDNQISLVDLTDGRLIARFDVTQKLSKDTTEMYLLKLFYIYKVLVEEKK